MAEAMEVHEFLATAVEGSQPESNLGTKPGNSQLPG